MLNKIKRFIMDNCMIEPGDRIVVGLSGGADSVCLLHALVKLYREKDVTFLAVHINHGIRGPEADRDEQFAAALCRELDVEWYPFHVDVRALAAELLLSEEEAGRKVRYEAFLSVCREQKCHKIAVAHNKNDNAETVLFHLFRGTGLKGLSGIGPIRQIAAIEGAVTLIRPLLCVERKEIEEYLRSEGIAYQVDSTNLTDDYSRNKIRNRVLSYACEEINTGAVANIHETAGKLSEAWAFIDTLAGERYRQLVKEEKGQLSFGIGDFNKEPLILRKEILRRVLEEMAGHLKDIETKHVEVILGLTERQVGKQVHLPYRITVERGYEEIRLYHTAETKEKGSKYQTKHSAAKQMLPVRASIPGVTMIPQSHKIFETEIIKYEKNDPIPKNSCMKWFDYDKIENAVEIRNRHEGDYIQINASGGRKKLKDYFIDQKIPQKQRDLRLLVTDGNHIMWIPGTGERMSEKYKVGPSTKNVLLMKMIDLEDNEDDR